MGGQDGVTGEWDAVGGWRRERRGREGPFGEGGGGCAFKA